MKTHKLTKTKAKEVIKNIREKIQHYFKQNNLTYAIFGKSEGLDSSVIAGLLSNLPGIKPIGVIIPCESDPEAERIGKLVLNHFSIPFIKVDVTKDFHHIMGNFYFADGMYGQLSEILKQDNDFTTIKKIPHIKAKAAGNIKARLRMIVLYHLAQLTSGLVVSTDNLSELYMGFWTINGDVGDISPIQHIFKGLEEYTIAEVLGVPNESLNAVPTDGLEILPGGTDEDQLGLLYHDLDQVIIALLQNSFDGSQKWKADKLICLADKLSTQTGYKSDKIIHVANQMAVTNFKRHWPRVFKRSELNLPEI